MVVGERGKLEIVRERNRKKLKVVKETGPEHIGRLYLLRREQRPSQWSWEAQLRERGKLTVVRGRRALSTSAGLTCYEGSKGPHDGNKPRKNDRLDAVLGVELLSFCYVVAFHKVRLQGSLPCSPSKPGLESGFRV